jgi:predicted dehydrogenase
VGTPWIPEHFFRKAETGGGAVIDLGAHPFYLSMLVHGEAPATVTAQVGYVTGREIEDNAAALLGYAGGVLGVAEMSMVGNHMGYSLEVTGTEGSIAVGPADQRVLLRRGHGAEWEEQELSPALPDPFDQWVEWIVSGRQDPGHLPLVRDVTRSIEAAYRSAESGAVVSLASLQ